MDLPTSPSYLSGQELYQQHLADSKCKYIKIDSVNKYTCILIWIVIKFLAV